MVDLVLENACVPATRVDRHRFAVLVEAIDMNRDPSKILVGVLTSRDKAVGS